MASLKNNHSDLNSDSPPPPGRLVIDLDDDSDRAPSPPGCLVIDLDRKDDGALEVYPERKKVIVPLPINVDEEKENVPPVPRRIMIDDNEEKKENVPPPPGRLKKNVPPPADLRGPGLDTEKEKMVPNGDRVGSMIPLKKRFRGIGRCTCPICITGINKWPGIKKFHSCHIIGCFKKYRTTSHLRAHLRSHVGNRPFKCTQPGCTKDFYRSDELGRHMRTHTHVRNYPCKLCEKRFLRSDHLSKHVKSHSTVRKPRQPRRTKAEMQQGKTSEETSGEDQPSEASQL
jgi:hypothetical protein